MVEKTLQFANRLAARTIAWIYKSRRRIATSTVVLVATLMAFHVVFGANGMVVFQNKRTEYRALDSEIQNLQKENDRLNQRIKALNSDPKTIEKEAREQLRYVRPGEVVYAVPEQKPAQTTVKTAVKH